jgi:hypothetical protein
MRKLYLTLEDGDLKIDRVIQLEPEIYHKYISEIIDDMHDSLNKVTKEEELVNETNRITTHND